MPPDGVKCSDKLPFVRLAGASANAAEARTQSPATPGAGARAGAMILLILILGSLAWYFAADRLTPYTSQARVQAFAAGPGAVLLCGRYEGIDQRVIDAHVTQELSLGDFVLSGGEIPALAVMDAVIRQLPGSLNNAESAAQESFVDGLLDAPCYTRPEAYRGETVPEVLLSGNHGEIAAWRRRQSLLRTALRRPDLLDQVTLTDKERAWISENL